MQRSLLSKYLSTVSPKSAPKAAPKVIFATVLLSLNLGLEPARAAYATAELWGNALKRSVPVEIAQAELTQAKAEVAKVKGDPLALRVNLIKANARLTQAKANLVAAQLAVRQNLAQDLARLSSAEYTVNVSKTRLDIAAMNLKAAKIRVKAGAINRLDFEKAETRERNAHVSLSQAESDLTIARENLRRNAGTLPQKKLTTFPKPQLATLQKALGTHPRQLRASSQVEINKYQLAVMSSDLTAPVEVRAAQNAVSSAQKNAEDIGRSLRNSLDQSWQNYRNALITLDSRQRSYNSAAENMRVQNGRFDKGLLSKAALLQSKEELQQAESQLDTARTSIETALTRLAVSANSNVWK